MENIIPIWALIPFVLMLLMIAIGPLVAEHWWEKNANKMIVSIFLGVPTAIFMIRSGLTHDLTHTIFFDYVPFIILLLALFVVTGGIYLDGDLLATPRTNTIFLSIGWVLASFMGTTGAAMLFIRPLLATNQQRAYKMHTVLFFIALVANCGGLLTPLGDPPLFMLFLRGADFFWFIRLFQEWLFAGVILLVMYYFTDSYFFKKEEWTAISADLRERKPLKIEGKTNFIYLLGIVLSVAFINPDMLPEMAEADAPLWMKYLREIVLLSFVGMSLYTTKRAVRYEKNKYSWTPIIEVAVLFLGIFTTMAPALIYLNHLATTGALPFTDVWHFYYATGALSAFLDNTPTAVTFHSMASGMTPEAMAALDSNIVAGIPEILLKAISMASVMFGALTYIGNGPNFMVKAIAEESGIKMPSFFGYMFKFSLIVLLPVYILIQLIFL